MTSPAGGLRETVDLFKDVAGKAEGLSQTSKSVHAFFEKWASIEEKYAKEMSKLVDVTASEFAKPGKFAVPGQAGQAWEAVMKYARTCGAEKRALAANLMTQVADPVSSGFRGDLERVRKTVTKEANDGLGSLASARAATDKAQKKYVAAARDLETLVVGLPSTAITAKVEAELEAAEKAHTNTQANYTSCINAQNGISGNVNGTIIPKAMDNLAKYCTHNVQKMKSVFNSLSTLITAHLVTSTENAAAISAAASAIDARAHTQQHVCSGMSSEEFRGLFADKAALVARDAVDFCAYRWSERGSAALAARRGMQSPAAIAKSKPLVKSGSSATIASTPTPAASAPAGPSSGTPPPTRPPGPSTMGSNPDLSGVGGGPSVGPPPARPPKASASAGSQSDLYTASDAAAATSTPAASESPSAGSPSAAPRIPRNSSSGRFAPPSRPPPPSAVMNAATGVGGAGSGGAVSVRLFLVPVVLR